MSRKTTKPAAQKESLPETVAGLASVLISGFFIITFVVHMFSIPSSSMERTILVGDHMFIDEVTPAAPPSYLTWMMPYRNLRRGDIAVFYSPVQPDLHLVKRIVGVPGDHIHLLHGVLYLNGVAQNEPYAIHDPSSYDAYRDDFPNGGTTAYGGAPEWPAVLRQSIQGQDVVVPPGHYFGMGDNRDNSLDSRYWGFIPRENIIGRPLVNIWSFEASEDQYQDPSASGRAGFVAYAVLHFFDKTRWSRTFHIVR